MIHNVFIFFINITWFYFVSTYKVNFLDGLQ